MKKKYYVFIIALICFTGFIFINNCQFTPDNKTPSPELLAHRGLSQTFDISKVKWDTNTAEMIYPPEHSYIENTIPSMEAAFKYGADIVEFDIRLTKDKELAVFHDYALDSRTEKKGFVYEYTLAELKKSDVGYGYTADNGKTFPLRGAGTGLMPSFDDVIQRFPDKKFLVHIRDDGKEIGYILLGKINRLEKKQIENISIYGDDQAIEIIRNTYPAMKALTAGMIKKALIEYFIIGWTGYIPDSIRNMELHLPLEYARFLWGWPYIFVKRMKSVNTRVVLVMKRGQWSGGFDTEDDIKKIPEQYPGCIWTERIDRIGKLFGITF